jgi:hypothetical protein
MITAKRTLMSSQMPRIMSRVRIENPKNINRKKISHVISANIRSRFPSQSLGALPDASKMRALLA